jgi:hypothetical protein
MCKSSVDVDQCTFLPYLKASKIYHRKPKRKSEKSITEEKCYLDLQTLVLGQKPKILLKFVARADPFLLNDRIPYNFLPALSSSSSYMIPRGASKKKSQRKSYNP